MMAYYTGVGKWRSFELLNRSEDYEMVERDESANPVILEERRRSLPYAFVCFLYQHHINMTSHLCR